MTKKFHWLTDEARQFLAAGYVEGMEVEEWYRRIADNYERISGIPGFGDKIYGYFEKGWASLASPTLSNFGNDKGLPASCNFSKIDDTLESIVYNMAEMGMLAKQGAGTARNFSNIRPYLEKYGLDGKSVGVLGWVEEYEGLIRKVTQGGVRRGFLTAYLSVSHPEIHEFLKIGDDEHHIKKITTAVTIPTGWIQEMMAGDKEKQAIFVKIHDSRARKGYPYILFEDNANKGKHQVYVDKDMWLDTSNICTECIEWTDVEKEFTCILASANLKYWDDFKDTDFFYDMSIMLDCVVTEYIEKGKEIRGLERAVKFAEEHRAIGLGVMSFHTLLQMKNIVFGSLESFRLNYEIFSRLRSEADRASKWMAKTWGEPAMLTGYGDRNTSRIAQAPTKSTSEIMGGDSEGIGVIKSNYHTKDLAKIQYEYKNPQLVKVLQGLGQDTKEVWKSILEQNGSVQHLSFLDSHIKEVFRTSEEISQLDVIKLAAQRQPFIDQAQSLNLLIPKDSNPKDVINLTLEAHKLGIKTLYYHYSINAAQDFNRTLTTCTSCEG